MVVSGEHLVHIELTVWHTLNEAGDLLFGYKGSLNIKKSQFCEGIEMFNSLISHARVIQRYKL